MPGAHHLPSELPSSACWSSGPVMALVLTGRGADTTGGTTLASPEWTHITFTYEHALVLGCEGWQVYDEGGFDRIIFDMWRDPDDEFMRLQATYPDDSIYQLLFEGQRRGWRRAWALGTDHGRRAGCTRAETAGSSSTVFAGETWLDHSPIAVTAVDSEPVEPGMFEPTGYDPVWDTERPVVTTAPAAP